MLNSHKKALWINGSCSIRISFFPLSLEQALRNKHNLKAHQILNVYGVVILNQSQQSSYKRLTRTNGESDF